MDNKSVDLLQAQLDRIDGEFSSLPCRENVERIRALEQMRIDNAKDEDRRLVRTGLTWRKVGVLVGIASVVSAVITFLLSLWLKAG